MLRVYQISMIVRIAISRRPARAVAVMMLLALGIGLAGCADLGGDAWTSAFADPAKYDLYDCKQLATTRQNLAAQAKSLKALMDKADTGVAGPLVAELAYRNEDIAVRAQSRLAEETWRRNKCHESAPTAAPAPAAAPPANVVGAPPPLRSGNAVY